MHYFVTFWDWALKWSVTLFVHTKDVLCQEFLCFQYLQMKIK